MQTVRDHAIWYLRNCSKGEERVAAFQKMTELDQRDGQAFINCLPTGELMRLVGADIDPYYQDSLIPAAVDLLTTKENQS